MYNFQNNEFKFFVLGPDKSRQAVFSLGVDKSRQEVFRLQYTTDTMS